MTLTFDDVCVTHRMLLGGFMEKGFVIKQQDFNKLSKLAENVYNTSVVVDYFCSNQTEYKELGNLAPVIKNLRHDTEIRLNIKFQFCGAQGQF